MLSLPVDILLLLQLWDNESTTSKLRLPDEVEARGKLRRQAEAAKTEIELKPCQNLIDYQLFLKEPTRVSRPD